MSDSTYNVLRGARRSLVWLGGAIRSPPLSREARVEAGTLLRLLQEGVSLGLPRSRPMPEIGKGCHELRVPDRDSSWRVIYRIDRDAIVILEVFAKKTAATPRSVIETCHRRARAYDSAAKGEGRRP